MNKYLSFIFASVLTLTGVQLSKASNPSDSLAIVSAKWERTSSLQGIQLKQASIEGLFGGKQSISILTIGRAEGYTAFIATTDSLTTTSQLAEQSRSSAAINGSYFSIKEGFSTCYLRKNRSGNRYDNYRRKAFACQWCRTHRWITISGSYHGTRK